MTPSEAARLLAHVAAFDRRTVGESDARAWAAALEDLPLDDDTMKAVVRYFAAESRWLMPADVRTGVRKIREDRARDIVGAGQPAEVPDADPDDVQGYLAALRDQRTRAAAGAVLRPRPVAELIASAGRPVVRPATGPLAVACPHCHSARGERCRLRSGGRLMSDYHPSRYDAAQAAATEGK
ncbi:hypothetical protein BIV57_05440 [Mangrovactinospora gilvigrisea]|uniref:DNA-binding phage zinc finger domain-containing protein n=1 Tax=Mangrovactinospora gilvigrisea TaxID=1428644 RepID=A0A1J7BIG9_9ACTN|nr:hypothetical protein [Mangrovactinospora gilvigrisea]OIV38451.1 hypothetical protein BIV57_05440 [Mangrovactinospora gilvigrisea]